MVIAGLVACIILFRFMFYWTRYWCCFPPNISRKYLAGNVCTVHERRFFWREHPHAPSIAYHLCLSPTPIQYHDEDEWRRNPPLPPLSISLSLCLRHRTMNNSSMERHNHLAGGGSPDLTKGGILKLIESEGHFSFTGRNDVKQPTLQIINIRRVPAKWVSTCRVMVVLLWIFTSLWKLTMIFHMQLDSLNTPSCSLLTLHPIHNSW